MSPPARPSLRGTSLSAAALTAVAVAVAGCSAGSAGSAGSATNGSATRGSAPAAPASAASTPPPPSSTATRPVVTSGTPGCSTATAPSRQLAVRAALTAVAGNPFGVAVSPDGRWTFVARSSAGAVGVFRNESSGTPAQAPGAPAAARRAVAVPGQPPGEALTRDGRYLLAATNAGAAVLDASRAEQGRPGALRGTLSSPRGGGAIEVAVSPDGRFAFVSLEDSGELAVFRLQRALAHGFGRPDFVGTIPVGQAPVGLAVSPDGRWLYATSELERSARVTRRSLGGPGTLSVISVRRAETDPAGSVLSTVTAGCGPVRVIASQDGSVIWVTARESDFLLGFSAARLRSDPARALIARVQVGEAPVGLALVAGGTRIVVADSNRFNAAGAASSLAVVSVPAALSGRPALLGYIRTGSFPREMAPEPGGRTLLVTDYGSQQLQFVDVASLP